MKKRMLSLLCVLALCLGLLPVTALAAAEGAPSQLYVGNQQVSSGNDITYWTTDPSTGELTLYTENGDDWNVKYDPNSATLTLKNATIKTTHNDSRGAVIYAESRSSSAVSLTIELEGTNTIECASAFYGIYVNAEMSYDSYGTDASLTITGEGSLDVSGSSDGIYIKSGTGNASLTINDASVVASSSSSYGHAGVYVMSSIYATGSPELSLAVNGGSLTASASEGNDGIQFYVGSSSDTTNATTSLTISDNAIVRAENGITAYRVDKPTPSGTGIVFDGTEGTVYGDVTLDESLTIDQGETLTIPEGASLTVPDGKTLTNNGTLVIKTGGQLNGTPTGSGTVITAPAITTASLPEGTVGTEYNQPLAATGNNITWSSSDLPAWLTLKSDGTITGIPTAEGSSTFTVTAENSAGSDSKEYTLNIKAVSVTGVKLDTDKLELFTGESKTLTAKVVPETATDKSVTWESSNTTVATVDQSGNVKAEAQGTATITVKTANGGFTDNCTVTVTDKTYTITADPAKLDFDAAYLGYKTQPAPQTVTITNTGNQQVTVTLPTAKDFVITAGDGFANGRATIEPGKTATFTVQPKADLAVGSYKESINISGFNGNHKVSTSVDATFAVVDINDTSVDNKLTVTSGISDNITYYTCPSCGYHNWTATDAGYRCDNCGYLESTRQLSGYGNVKGTYTPGSGATSTAASAVPQTGDESNPVLWTVLLLVSGLALGGLAIAKRKKQQ